jgi:redox-sensitive bicupin YhaK (pirin superfamily)
MVRRPAEERGHADHGWLDTCHTFSFAGYHDPDHMGFRTLRVINEDRVQPGAGFGAHPHQDMEILTYVLDGALEHRDSMGNRGVIRAGEVQRMSAGTGVVHSEANASGTDLVHFFQIWILPDRRGLPPGYEQRAVPADDTGSSLYLVAAPEGGKGAVTIHQDARVYLSRLGPGEEASHPLDPGRHAWAHVVRGRVTLNGMVLATGDGAAVSGERSLSIAAVERSEVLLFDLS